MVMLNYSVLDSLFDDIFWVFVCYPVLVVNNYGFSHLYLIIMFSS